MRNLRASPLSRWFRLDFFQTGSVGAESPARDEPVLNTVRRLLVGPFALAWRIVTNRPAVVHINSSPDLRAFSRDATLLAAAKLLRRKVVFQLHGGTLAALTDTRLMRAITKFVFRLPDVIVVLAGVSSDEFRSLGRTRGVTLVPNGVDIPSLTGMRPRQHTGRVSRLGYLGRLVDTKGLTQTIDALAILRSEPSFSELELRLAGSGDAADRLSDHARARGVEDAVHFVGTVSGEAKLEFLRDTDVFVLVGSHNEGMPYALLEAMAVGTPVVVSEVGGNVDVVRDHVDGLTVPPEDSAELAIALRDLAADPQALREMSTAAATRAAAEYSLERMATRLRDLYSDLGANPATTSQAP